MLKKLFRCGKPVQWDILEKETVDEIIFRTIKLRNRIILELMARGGMRIGEVLNLTPKDIDEQKLTIRACLKRLLGCESTHHQFDHGNPNHVFTCFW